MKKLIDDIKNNPDKWDFIAAEIGWLLDSGYGNKTIQELKSDIDAALNEQED